MADGEVIQHSERQRWRARRPWRGYRLTLSRNRYGNAAVPDRLSQPAEIMLRTLPCEAVAAGVDGVLLVDCQLKNR
jgi:hypothetical protein